MTKRTMIILMTVCFIVFFVACVSQSVQLKGTWQFVGYKDDRVKSIIDIDSTVCFDGDGIGLYYRNDDPSASKSFTYVLSKDDKLVIIIDERSSIVECSIDPKTKRLTLDGLEYKLVSSEADAIKTTEAEPSSIPTPTPRPADTPIPKPTLSIETIAKADRRKTIAAGGVHIVGLRSDGTAVAAILFKNPQTPNSGQCDVEGWKDIVAVDAGYWYTVGMRADGTVVAVGSDNVDNDWKDIVAVSAGAWHVTGLKADGTVAAMGGNEHGQCEVSGWKDIVSIAAGWDHTVGLKADGTVVTVGSNDYGQRNVSGWKDIVAIAAGEAQTVGLKADGTVVVAGYPDQNTVGHWTDITAIAAGQFHIVGLKADGTVVAAGDDLGGRCDVSDWKDIVAIAADQYFTVGLKADGTVVVAGDGDTPQDICDVSDWKNIRVPEK